MKIFDTHAHYNDSRFNDYEGGMDKAIRDSYDAGICGFINCGTCTESSRRSIDIAKQYENAYAAVGIHPESAEELRDNLNTAYDEIISLFSDEKVVAIGEIGLDYHWDIEKEIQHEVLEDQLDIATQYKMPVIIHDREAHGAVFDAIKRHPDVIGVMHGYSGSAEMAKEYAKMGWYIAFGGPVTYKTAEKVREACRAVPLDRILIETDCPYLPPVPHRGEINLSKNMIHTIKIMAETRGEDIEALAASMIENTKRLFGIEI